MYAQVVRRSGELIPALHDEPGFAGALSLVKRRTGEGIMIVLWQSAEQARRPLGDDRSASAGDHEPMSVWEVTGRV